MESRFVLVGFGSFSDSTQPITKKRQRGQVVLHADKRKIDCHIFFQVNSTATVVKKQSQYQTTTLQVAYLNISVQKPQGNSQRFFFFSYLLNRMLGEKQSFQLYVDVTYAVLVLIIQDFNYQHFVNTSFLPPKGDFILNILQHKFINTEKYPTVI